MLGGVGHRHPLDQVLVGGWHPGVVARGTSVQVGVRVEAEGMAVGTAAAKDHLLDVALLPDYLLPRHSGGNHLVCSVPSVCSLQRATLPPQYPGPGPGC